MRRKNPQGFTAYPKGFSNQIHLVVAVVIAMVFALVFWSATSGSMQEAFDSVFGMATGFGGGGP
jgi:hypothetical protein